MSTRTEPVHDWNANFWDDAAGKKTWMSDFPAEDRPAFELEVEGMVGSSIPMNLGSLTRAYRTCTWNWPANAPGNPWYPVKVATVDLHTALRVATYCRERLEAGDVLDQLPGQVYGVTRARNGVQLPRPKVPLPFSEDHLKTFVQDLKAYAFLTLWQFASEYPEFMAALPDGLSAALHEELFEIAVLMLIEKLESSTAEAQPR